jgi:hypothetical protein
VNDLEEPSLVLEQLEEVVQEHELDVEEEL